MAELTNQVDIAGQYGNPASAISFSSNLVSTTIVEGLTVLKEADKTNWVDGPLTYTITVQNNSGETLSSGKLTDQINTTLVNFSTTYGVQLDGQTYRTYTYNDGTLEITLPDLANGEQKVIKFQVTRKS